MPDATVLSIATERIAFTTGSCVVLPLCFPAGNIGTVAVYGTVNDLAGTAAVPRWLSLALIIEEGFTQYTAGRILDSSADAAARCGVAIMTGDTKVVPHGVADGLFINTTGIGELTPEPPSGPESIRCRDILIVSGPIGCHGVVVLTAREDLFLEPSPESDSAALHTAVAALRQKAAGFFTAIRDATRGSISAVLHEWSAECRLTMTLQESRIPISDRIRGASELLGIDALSLAKRAQC